MEINPKFKLYCIDNRKNKYLHKNRCYPLTIGKTYEFLGREISTHEFKVIDDNGVENFYPHSMFKLSVVSEIREIRLKQLGIFEFGV